MNLRRVLVSAMVLLAVASCTNSAQVQRTYIATRDECRARAEGEQGQYIADEGLTDRDRNAVLATLFSDCMFQMGWTVATPPREGGDGGGGGGIIDTAREKPQAQALAPEQQSNQGGNVTLQPSPLPLSPTEKSPQAAKPVPADTQFPHSTYQSVPPRSPNAKGNAAQGGVAVVTPAKKPSVRAKPAPLKVKPATTPAEKEGLSSDQQEMLLDSLNRGR